LSDLHYDPTRCHDSKIVIDALTTTLSEKRLSNELAPDLVFFTGDLVQAGTYPQYFDAVHETFVLPVLRATELSMERFYICPGNHDIDREVVRNEPWIENGLKGTLTSVDEVNKFMDSVQADPARGDKPLQRLTNWFRYAKTLHAQHHIRQDPFLTTYQIEVKGTKIGISSFNTAWRATGEGNRCDHGNLSMGERAVDRSINDLPDCDIRMALHHHPLEWLLADEHRVLGNRLYGSFDALFHGHLHVSQPELRQNMFGKAVISECGCIYESRRYFNGFQYVVFDTDEKMVTFEVFTYFNARRAFDRAANLPGNGRITFGYSNRSVHSRTGSIRAIMERARPVIRESASRHMALDQTEGGTHDIKEFFVCPPLTHDPSWIAGLTAVTQSSDLDEILTPPGDIVFVGTRECGKTTLAHYIAFRTTEGATDRPRIPVILVVKIKRKIPR
jgi:predicted MPP superfamily phosphohydrolase